MKKFLFFVEQTYSFAILRPLQDEIKKQGHQVAWFLLGVSPEYLTAEEEELKTLESVIAFDPYAVFVPGNRVPKTFPGIKVQVFHGFGIEKKGHFRIRGFFDLYCTHGPLTTEPFLQLAAKHKHFHVVETGWPKMDPMAGVYDARDALDAPYKVLYAPTFSPSLTSAEDLLPQLIALSQRHDYHITVKFHPKMDAQWVRAYQKAQHPRLIVQEDVDFLECVDCADIVISDTSSVVAEALCIGKPVITYKTHNQSGCSIDFDQAEQLVGVVENAVANYQVVKQRGVAYANQMHPYADGKSSERVLQAVLSFERAGLKQKPRNYLRYWKLAKEMRSA